MYRNPAGQVRSVWLLLLAVSALLLAQVIFSLPGTIYLMVVEIANNGDILNADTMALFDTYPWIGLLTQGGGAVGGIAVTLLLWRYINKKSVKELGFRGSVTDLGFGLLLGAVSITLIALILLVTGNVQLVNSFSAPAFTTYTITFLLLFVIVAFSEEMFFRGYVMSTRVDRGTPRWLVYGVSALLFSVVHGANPNVTLIGLANILFVGILFAYMFEVTKGLWVPIGYHMTWNYFQGNVFGFAVSGTTPHGIYNVRTEEGNPLLTGGSFGLEGGLLATLLIVIGFFATHLYARSQKGSSATQVESE